MNDNVRFYTKLWYVNGRLLNDIQKQIIQNEFDVTIYDSILQF